MQRIKITMIASGSHTAMYRWHGTAVADEGPLPLPMGEVPWKGGEGGVYHLCHFVTAPPEGEAKGITDCEPVTLVTGSQ